MHYPQIAYQGEFHDFVLNNEFDQMTQRGFRCVKEVRLMFVRQTARLDMLCAGPIGVLAGIETKTGDNPTLTPDQAFIYAHTIVGAGVTSPDSKINALGLPPNAPLPPIPIFILYAAGPDQPYRHFDLKPEPLTKAFLTTSYAG